MGGRVRACVCVCVYVCIRVCVYACVGLCIYIYIYICHNVRGWGGGEGCTLGRVFIYTSCSLRCMHTSSFVSDGRCPVPGSVIATQHCSAACNPSGTCNPSQPKHTHGVTGPGQHPPHPTPPTPPPSTLSSIEHTPSSTPRNSTHGLTPTQPPSHPTPTATPSPLHLQPHPTPRHAPTLPAHPLPWRRGHVTTHLAVPLMANSRSVRQAG